jgi:hypothetical protein
MIYPPAGIPVSTGSAWGTSITNNSANWNTAFSWGNHALAGYLTGTAIGTTVQPYNANTVIDAAYVHTDNNYTTAEKSKLAGIAAGAEVNVNADWNATSGDAQILNKPTIPTQVLVDSIPTDGSNNAVSSNGVFDALASKADLVGGKVPTAQLPSYVDDVIEGYYSGTAFYSDAGFTTIINGETGKIYVDLLQNRSYRWTGSLYIQISNAISSINDLTDVTIASVNNGQILQYNSTTSQWQNTTITIGTGDMQKTTYDIDDDGVVDYSETVAVTVRNPSVSDILRRGTIVYLNGSTGNRPNAYKAQADTEATSSGTFGVVVDDIGLNSDGLVAALGTLHDLDTRTAAGGAPYPFTSDTLLDGDAIWLSPTTAGYVTRVKPTAPNHAVFIGIVARTSPTNGRIIYRIQNGYELEELHNVAISNIQPNQVIKYDGSKWINATTPAAGNNTEVQYNNSGSLGASSNFTWDNVNQSLNLITPIGNLSPSLLLKATDVNATGQYNITQSTLKQSTGGSGVDYNLLSELTFDSYANNNYINTPLKISNLIDVSSSSTVLTSSLVTVNGSLKITNIPTTVTTANGILGITDEGTLFKTSLGSSLTLSSTGTFDVSTLPFNKITAGQAQLTGSQNIAINYSNTNSGLLVSNSGYSVLGSPDGLRTLTVDNTGVYTTSSTAIGTNSINPNAILSLNSTTKGLLLPAVNDTDRGLMNLPSDGIMIYNPSVGKFQGRAGNAWVDFGGGGSAAGNTGQVQFNNAGAFGASSNLFWNNTTNSLAIGSSNANAKLDIMTSVTEEEEFILFPNSIVTSATATNWSGTSFATGYTHTPGSITAILSTESPQGGIYYKLTYTITNRTIGTVSIGFGNVAATGSVSTSGSVIARSINADKLTITPSTDFDGTVAVTLQQIIGFGTLGPELLTTATLGTGWTGTSFATGYTHNANNTTNITAQNLTLDYSNYYVSWTVTNYTSGSFYISCGNHPQYGITSSGYNIFGPSFGTFSINSTNGAFFYGTVQVSLRKIIPRNPIIKLENSKGLLVDVRNNNNNITNLNIGYEAGLQQVHGIDNINIGVRAGKFNYSSNRSIIIGNFADSTVKTDVGLFAGVGNSVLIGHGISSASFGDSNVVIGCNGTGAALTQAQNVVIIGTNTASTLTTGSGGIYIKGSASAGGATNEIAIGGNTGLGSNTTSIGQSSTLRTHLYGNITTDNSVVAKSSSASITTSNVLTTSTTTTGWTGTSFSGGYTHTAGNTNTLIAATAAPTALPILSGQKYTLTYTLSGVTAGTVTITIGGLTTGAVGVSGTLTGITTNTNSLTITPTSDFNGTIVATLVQVFDTSYYSTEAATTGSGINWTGTSYATGYTHTVGATTALNPSNLSLVLGAAYELTYTSSGITAGSATLVFGDLSTTISTNTTLPPNRFICTNTANPLRLTPTSNFDGTVIISIKRLAYSAASIQGTSLQVFGSGTDNIASFVKNDGSLGVGVSSDGILVPISNDTNTSFSIRPKGTGAFILGASPDGTATGGNSRGANSIDLQILRSNAGQIASGSQAFIAGGSANTASGNSSAVLGGYGNVSSGQYGVTAGWTCTASGDRSVSLGAAGTASAQFSIALNNGSTASAISSFAAGAGSVANLYASQAFASARFVNNGDAQTMSWRYLKQITGTAAKELTLDGADISAQGRATLVANRAWNVRISLTAICSTAGGTVALGDTFIAEYIVGIKRIGTTTTLLGPAQLITSQYDVSMQTSAITITADDTNDYLKVEFTPPSATASAVTIINVIATATATVAGY